VNVLITGAIVVDVIGQYTKPFAVHDLSPPYQHIAFDALSPIDRLSDFFGGCGPNVAYNLALLGLRPALFSVAGSDFERAYRPHLERAGVDLRLVQVLPEPARTPMAFVITDSQARQFSFWAVNDVHAEHFRSVRNHCEQAEIVVVASNFSEVMLRDLADADAPERTTVWCPGGDVFTMTGAALREAWSNSTVILVNEAEWRIALAAMETDAPPWPSSLRAIFVTRGAAGALLFEPDGASTVIPAAPARAVVDPTGCGDAFAAGVVWGLTRGMALADCGRAGSRIAAVCLQSMGAQNHRLESW